MGLAVLPSRLKGELTELKALMLEAHSKNDMNLLTANETLSKHADWAKEILKEHKDFSEANAEGILKEETGKVFEKVLEDAGVYKRTEEGRAAFERFIGVL